MHWMLGSSNLTFSMANCAYCNKIVNITPAKNKWCRCRSCLGFMLIIACIIICAMMYIISQNHGQYFFSKYFGSNSQENRVSHYPANIDKEYAFASSTEDWESVKPGMIEYGKPAIKYPFESRENYDYNNYNEEETSTKKYIPTRPSYRYKPQNEYEIEAKQTSTENYSKTDVLIKNVAVVTNNSTDNSEDVDYSDNERNVPISTTSEYIRTEKPSVYFPLWKFRDMTSTTTAKPQYTTDYDTEKTTTEKYSSTAGTTTSEDYKSSYYINSEEIVIPENDEYVKATIVIPGYNMHNEYDSNFEITRQSKFPAQTTTEDYLIPIEQYDYFDLAIESNKTEDDSVVNGSLLRKIILPTTPPRYDEHTENNYRQTTTEHASRTTELSENENISNLLNKDDSILYKLLIPTAATVSYPEPYSTEPSNVNDRTTELPENNTTVTLNLKNEDDYESILNRLLIPTAATVRSIGSNATNPTNSSVSEENLELTAANFRR